ncbi:TPA: hypothetical protein ACGWVL_003038 [Pseudomonas aeruginosa]
MFRLLMAFAWPMLVIWAALQVGHSLQVIDTAKVIVRDKAACQALQVPYDTSCRVVGRMEAKFDGSWWLQPKDAGGIYIRLPEGSLPYSYSPDDYHIRGGKPASIALVVVTALLMLLGPLISWRLQARRVKRESAQTQI